jgi:3-oxoacyl-[acyl-carrier-protein] synthase II
LIRDGTADVVMAGGTEAAVTPLTVAAFARMGALSSRNDDPERASRPFDADRDGFVIGEGAGCVVLEPLERARARGATIYGEVAGYGRNADAYHITAPSPGGAGAAVCMQLALDDAAMEPSAIGHVNAHGTSTPLNDASEAAAIANVLGEHARTVAVSSTKSMTGHQMGAAGAVEGAACALAITHGRIPPTIHHRTPDPDIGMDVTPNEARELNVRFALSNSFGFGGHNTCVAFRTTA